MNHSSIHPDDALLAAFSAASLPLSQAMCISVHLEYCAECQHKTQRLNRVGSELMQQLKPAPATSELKDGLLAKLDTLVETASPEQTPQTDRSIPRCLRQFVGTSYQNMAWQRLSPDIHSVELCHDTNGAKTELLRIRPGGTATTHTHLGDEYTVILEGSFSDETGVYRQGDFMLRDASDVHTPVATMDRECICLAVTEGPIQFTGFFRRMLNPLIRRSYA